MSERSEEALTAAQELVREAQALEMAEALEEADALYREAADLYEDAGLDPVWFDAIELEQRIDDRPDNIVIGGNPYQDILVAYPEERRSSGGPTEINIDEEDEWILANPRIIESIDP